MWNDRRCSLSGSQEMVARKKLIFKLQSTTWAVSYFHNKPIIKQAKFLCVHWRSNAGSIGGTCPPWALSVTLNSAKNAPKCFISAHTKIKKMFCMRRGTAPFPDLSVVGSETFRPPHTPPFECPPYIQILTTPVYVFRVSYTCTILNISCIRGHYFPPHTVPTCKVSS